MELTTPQIKPLSFAAPVEQTERLVILDSLRGFAILGILLMNIPGFGLPYVAVFDLSVLNELSGLNFKSWLLIEGIMEGSMRGLFSMLFGAGMILFINRLEKKNTGMIPAEIYFRRQIWLLVFGLINTYILLWFWDILFMYAVCGMLLFVFRRMPAKGLFIAAGICLLLTTAREIRGLYKDKSDIKQGEQIALLDTTTNKLTDAQKEKLATCELKERAGMPPVLFIVMLLLLYLIFTIFISSTSGMAVVTMPIIGSLAVVIGIQGKDIVSAYLYGMGIMNIMSPTGLILPSLALVNVSYKTWLKFVFPLMLILTIICALFLIAGALWQNV